MANEEITISELELADEVLADMVVAVDTTTDTKAVTLSQIKAWLGSSLPTGFILPSVGKMSDERFTLLDGKTLARTGTYEAFCNKVIEKVQAGDWTAVTEAQYNQELAATGQCGKFVITNDYVRIPKLGNSLYSAEISGLCSVKGNGKALGITDGSNNYGLSFATSSPPHATAASGNVNVTVGTAASGNAPSSNIALGIITDGAKSGIETQIEELNGEVFVYWYMVISTNGQTEQIEVDINEVYEDLNLKANTTLSNVPASKGILTESYVNGTSWYRVYSDGWCEQGGLLGSTPTNTNVSLLKAYANTGFGILLTSNSQGDSSTIAFTARQKTTSSFKIGTSTTATGCYWQACGYIS